MFEIEEVTAVASDCLRGKKYEKNREHFYKKFGKQSPSRQAIKIWEYITKKREM